MQSIDANLVKLLVNIVYVMVHTDAFSCPTEKNFILGFDQTCCKPIQCLENQGYRLCSNIDSLGYDTCYDCPPGTINREQPVNTATIRFEFEFCTKIDCNCLPEAELQNREECEKTGNKICVCRRWDGYYGNDPGACQGPINDEIKVEKIRQPGFELKITGEVDKCEVGFFKNKSDNSICIPHTKCLDGFLSVFNGSTTQDRECQRITTTRQPDTTAQPDTTKLAVTTKVLVNSTLQLITTSKTAVMLTTSKLVVKSAIMNPNIFIGDERSTPDPDPVNKEPEEGSTDSISVPALGLILGFGLLIVVLVLVCICCCSKRKLEQLKPNPELKKVDRSAASSPDISNTTGDEETIKMSERDPLLSVIDETVHINEKDMKESCQEPNGSELKEELSNCCNHKAAVSLSSEDPLSVTMTGQDKIHCSEVFQQSCAENEESHNTADLNTAVKAHDIKVCEHESPKIEKIRVEKQKSDPINIVKKTEPCSRHHDIVQMENSSDIFLAPDFSPLIFTSDPQPPNSYGSLMTDENYTPLSLSSLGEEYRVPADSDYGTGSSTKNDSSTSDSLGSSGKYTNLHLSSLQSNEENLKPGQPNMAVVPPQKESQQNPNNPKVVAIVSPLRRDEKGTLKTVDEEQTYSKTP
ncbi:uncharacterized protein LOC133182649 [Saccostrea echinata]|uniref:uncharacterized protein LOC133182649 n=1 Tax=Saccostrea echinata TaxID=191078 RepID=UPI002A7FB5A4|nr:uncharacterized protein LOC133182649 [Saccostrea echinata]